MEQALVYAAYAAAGGVALAVYCALPKEGRPPRPVLAVILSAIALGGLLMLLGRLLGDASGRFYCCVLSLVAVLGAMRVVTHPKPVYSALYFLMVVLGTAALMVLAGAEFLAAALVIVYAGAILVTYVFVIMMAQQSAPRTLGRLSSALNYDRSAREPAAAVLAGFVLVATVAGVIVEHDWPVARQAAEAATGESNTLALGRALFMEKAFPISLQLAGVLLMIAMIGAIAIARKRLPRAEEDVEALPPGEIGRRAKPF